MGLSGDRRYRLAYCETAPCADESIESDDALGCWLQPI